MRADPKPASSPEDIEKLIQKTRSYCAYQERGHEEVFQKLKRAGLSNSSCDQIISQLISEGYINESRFAILYAGGKFRIKKWGKIKIELSLRQKKVSPYNIKAALSAIDSKDYRKTLEKILEDKIESFKGLKLPVKKHKAAQYAISRGFEAEMVWGILAMSYEL